MWGTFLNKSARLVIPTKSQVNKLNDKDDENQAV
jgi:hypothetical protein